MLILLFRGIFLIGILSWYSTNVWKMIDGYFKERFEQYLQREYEKNPKMRDDVDAYGTAVRNDGTKGARDVGDKSADRLGTLQRRTCASMTSRDEETCSIDLASVEAAAGVEAGSGSLSSTLITGEDTMGNGRTSESEVIIGRGEIDKNAFARGSSFATAMETGGEKEVPTPDGRSFDGDNAPESLLIDERIVVERARPKPTMNSGVSKQPASESIVAGTNNADPIENVGRKAIKRKSTQRRFSREPLKSKTTEDEDKDGNKAKKKKKQKVKTIMLTEEDFKQAKIRSGLKDYDFSEFDDEAGSESPDEPPEGILVSQLPFKPRADIGNLERVTDDEFCPLTLEDEVNCGETRTWP